MSPNFFLRSVAKELSKEGSDPIRERLHAFARAFFEKPFLENMAVAAGVNYQQLTAYSSERLPSGPVLARLRSRPGMSIDWLLAGSGPMRKDGEWHSLADQLEEIAMKVRDVQLDELRSKVRAADQDTARLPF